MKRYQFNPKEMLFLDALIENKGNITKACKQAAVNGYTARSLLRDPRFKSEMRRRLPMTAREVLMQISSLARKGLEDLVVVALGPDGKNYEATIRTADWLRALELMAKYHNLLGEKHDQGETHVTYNFNLGGIAGGQQKALPEPKDEDMIEVEGELVN